MIPFKITTSLFTLEVFRRGIVFTIASILFASGVNLCNGNIFLLLISIFNKQVFKEDVAEYGFWVGVTLIPISLFLFYLIIINWRIEIYSQVFLQVRKTIDVYGTVVNHRYHYIGSEKLRSLQQKAHESYVKTVEFLNENQTNLDIETYNLARGINNKIGESILEFDFYIKEVEKIELNGQGEYDLSLSNKALKDEVSDITEDFNNFVLVIKEKEKFKISTK